MEPFDLSSSSPNAKCRSRTTTMTGRILFQVLGQTLGTYVSVVSADLARIFGRFRIWSVISIPVMLVFMFLKWYLMLFLLPVNFIVNLSKTA